MESPLKKEFDFFLANRTELLSKYSGKFVVIKNQSVVGVFDDELSAVEETKKSHELGTFLVQQVSPDSDTFTQTFHSRVVFSAPTLA